MGLFSSKSSSQTYSNPVSLQDVQGQALVGNQNSTISITDSGAFGVVRDIANAAILSTAEATRGIVEQQQAANTASLEAAFKTARPETSANEKTMQTVMVIAAIVGAAVAFFSWARVRA